MHRYYNTLNKVNVILLITTLFFISCSNDDLALNTPECKEYMQTIQMKLDIYKTDFDHSTDKDTTRSSSTWSNGDTIYLRFHTDKSIVLGNATYSEKNQDWTVNYYGSLKRDEETIVEVTYIDSQNIELIKNKLSLDGHNAIYQDLEGKYTYPTEGPLMIYSELKPITSRIRFKGEDNTWISIGGLRIYTEFDLESGEFSKERHPYSFVGEYVYGEYTDYIYGVFYDTESPQIKINDGTNLFIADGNSNMMMIGKSGYMTIPTTEKHNGWDLQETPLWGVINNQYWQDLGLPSGNLWNDMNVGADIIEYHDCGEYNYLVGEQYCWGETKSYTKCISKDDIQGSNYDIAHTSLKDKWVMPNKSDIEELINYCYFDFDNIHWDITYNGDNRYYDVYEVPVYGPNGGSIYLPFKYVTSKGTEYYYKYWSSTFSHKSTDSDNSTYYYSYALCFDECNAKIKAERYYIIEDYEGYTNGSAHVRAIIKGSL